MSDNNLDTYGDKQSSIEQKKLTFSKFQNFNFKYIKKKVFCSRFSRNTSFYRYFQNLLEAIKVFGVATVEHFPFNFIKTFSK